VYGVSLIATGLVLIVKGRLFNMNHNMTYRETKETPQEYLPIMEDLRDPTPTPVVNVTPTTVEAGKSTFTVANNKGEHYTFMVTKKDPEPGTRWVAYGPSWFVALLTGPNNDQDYTYMGVLNHAADTMYVYLTKARSSIPIPNPFRFLTSPCELSVVSSPFPTVTPFNMTVPVPSVTVNSQTLPVWRSGWVRYAEETIRG